MCLAQGHNVVTQVRLEPMAPRFRVNTLPLSHCAPRDLLINEEKDFCEHRYLYVERKKMKITLIFIKKKNTYKLGTTLSEGKRWFS